MMHAIIIVSTEECPNPSTVFDSTNADPSSVRSVLAFGSGQIKGSEFDYKCQSGFVLFVSKNGGDYERAPSDSITYECLRSTGSTFDPSIRANGRPKCMSYFKYLYARSLHLNYRVLGFPLCPELPSVSNGAVSSASREPGATATYSCDQGYDLSGPRTRTCGQDGKWSGQEPSCESKF
jgi:hypothetical protein